MINDEEAGITQSILYKLNWHRDFRKRGCRNKFVYYADGEYWCDTMYILRPVSTGWQLIWTILGMGNQEEVDLWTFGYKSAAQRCANQHAIKRGVVADESE